LGIETRAAAFDPLTASEEQLRVRLELASRLGALAADAATSRSCSALSMTRLRA